MQYRLRSKKTKQITLYLKDSSGTLTRPNGSQVKGFVMLHRCTVLLCYPAVRYLPSGNCSEKVATLTLPVTRSQRVNL